MFPKPYNLSNKSVNNYLKKIGEIIVLMGFLEAWIDFQIWDLVDAKGDANEGQAIGIKISSAMMYRQKIDLLLLLVATRFPRKIVVFKRIHSTLLLLGEKRNKFIHSQWFTMYGNREEHRKRNTHIENLRYGVSKKDGSLDFSKAYSTVKLSDLTKLINDIRVAHTNITKFFMPG